MKKPVDEKLLAYIFPAGTLFWSVGPLPSRYVSNGIFRYDKLVDGWICTDGGVVFKDGVYANAICNACSVAPPANVAPPDKKIFLKKACGWLAGKIEAVATNPYVLLGIGAFVGAFIMFSILLVIFKF